MNKPVAMTREAIDAYVAAKWPQAVISPVANVIKELVSYDEAKAHAQDCIESCDGWTIETLSNNIESNFPEIGMDACDEIAEEALNGGQS